MHGEAFVCVSYALFCSLPRESELGTDWLDMCARLPQWLDRSMGTDCIFVMWWA